MAPANELLTANEAALVAQVTVREVHRALDEAILPAELWAVRDDVRRVKAVACPLIGFYFSTAATLTAEQRRRVIGTVCLRLETANVRGRGVLKIHESHVTIDVAPYFKGAADRMRQLRKANRMVVEDPAVLGGTPVVRGTRIPVHDVAASAKAGTPRDRILQAYPRLPGAAAIDLAVLYADCHPMRGPRRKISDLPGAKLIRSARVKLPPR